jgi:hypothetical protein
MPACLRALACGRLKVKIRAHESGALALDKYYIV